MRVGPLEVVLLLAAAVFAEDRAKPKTTQQVADAVLAAFKAKDAAALKALAEKDDPDPWLVADELCFRGEHDAAEAFARAAPRKDTRALPEYVVGLRGVKPDAHRRDAIETARRARAAARWPDVLVAVEGVDTKARVVGSVRVLYYRAHALCKLRRPKEAQEGFVAASERAHQLRWFANAAQLTAWGATVAWKRRDLEGCLRLSQRRLSIEEARDARRGITATLKSIAAVLQALGREPQALPYLERLIEMSGDEARDPGIHYLVGRGLLRRGEPAKALARLERALQMATKAGDRGLTAEVLLNIGNARNDLGRYAAALEAYETSFELRRQLGDRVAAARTLLNIGVIHRKIGNSKKALELYQRSLSESEAVGDRERAAVVQLTIGMARAELGDLTGALESLKDARRRLVKSGNQESAAAALDAIGVVLAGLGRTREALACFERVRADAEKAGRHWAADALINIAGMQGRLRDHDAAFATAEKALALTRESGNQERLVHALWLLASIHNARGEHRRAANRARSATNEMTVLVRGLAEEEGARARGQWTKLLDAGVRAALALDDTDELAYFLESGRAGALLESLGGRQALGDAALPTKLREEETEARAAVRAAQSHLGAAHRAGKRKEIRSARAALGGAQERLLNAVARIQRAAKAAADVAYPKAAPLEKIQARLAPGEVLLSYGTLSGKTIVLVTTRDGARVVRLGEVANTLRLNDSKEPWEQSAAALRKALVEPLGLPRETKRLLISPSGAISYVPFAALAPEQEVVYVPSGTTYGVLLGERARRGTKVLALGDPDYATKADARAARVLRGGAGLVPLPATRVEAQAVGDAVLLGSEASVEGLLAATKRHGRWRAVHLACHGLVNPERPQLSSLALSGSFLSVLDVFRAEIPADLVVLSACETGKGKIYRSEGIVGFTRAFMLAGAPRVIVSLWKVDDEATRALMVKFYELWKPGTVPTATALKQAQEFVRGHEKWKHPYYWAAWQLWGLGN